MNEFGKPSGHACQQLPPVSAARLSGVRSRILDLGSEPVGNSPSAFGVLQKAGIVRWAQVIKASGAKDE